MGCKEEKEDAKQSKHCPSLIRLILFEGYHHFAVGRATSPITFASTFPLVLIFVDEPPEKRKARHDFSL
jgi:hypothetical protein